MNDEAACQGRHATNHIPSKLTVASVSDVRAKLEEFDRRLRLVEQRNRPRGSRQPDIEQVARWCRHVDAAVRVGQSARARTEPMFVTPEEPRAS